MLLSRDDCPFVTLRSTDMTTVRRVWHGLYAARLVLGNFDFMNNRGEDIVKSLNWQTVKERLI